nr:DNA helicase [Tanacetum cinerariifolium]GEX02419.1 DNA helicase [Tanacetum cinerariifolium]
MDLPRDIPLDNVEVLRSILTDSKVTTTKHGRMTKSYSSPGFIANSFVLGIYKDGRGVFTANKDTTVDVWIRKNTQSPLVARAKKALSNRTVNIDRKRNITIRLLAIHPEDALFTRSIRRMHHFGGLDESTLNLEIVEGLIHVLDEHDGLVRLFRTARDRCNASDIRSFKIRLYNVGGVGGYELPTADVLRSIMFKNGPRSRIDFDVIIEFEGGPPQRINKLHQSYMLLQFPLLFIFGQPGYYPELTLKPRDHEGISAGSKIMLPNTFTEGPWYMYNHYLDALLICRSLGNPQFFITFTCNVKWHEIKCYMAQFSKLTPTDRADIVCRVFEQKVEDFLRLLKEVKTFGYVSAVLYTIEFQKRGLPHCHTLLWIESRNTLKDATQIDEYISAEIPDPMQDPRGYKLVTKLMMHGPCGAANLDASWHHEQIDEIQNYADGRFICPHEACWRIFDFSIHCRQPAVQILNVYLEDMQHINFRERDRLDIIVNIPEKKKTTLTEWFVYNNENSDIRHLTYLNFPSEFMWYPNSKQWRRRQIRFKKSLGRLTYIHPSSCDLFYFRMLQCHQKGCKSPDEVRTINSQMLPNFRAACEALGLLGDDKDADPVKLWAKHLEAMQDDISTKISEATGIQNYHVNNAELQGYILYELEKKILNHFGKSVTDFGLQSPPWHLLKKSQLRNLLVETYLIIWDATPINVKLCFETLERILRDLMDAPNVLFGGKMIVLGGDFGQTLPKKGVGKELIAASIAESHLWCHFRICTLKENMNLQRSGLTNEERKRSETFAKWVLGVGDEKIGKPEEEYQDSFWITIPPEYSVDNNETSLSKLINFIYDDITLKTPTASSLQEKAIVCPKNITTDDMNAKNLSNIEGQSKIYLSNDEPIPMGSETSEI